ncbi:uncharacterized protein Dwil_GK28027 [Drosophila willistoni]|uniref:Uncharacterized protein n=1 Tax=Drosophila willistoni TaxID=7260 RepID=A0A0Q9WQD0_DROWI|nr:uncharacterized protein LOC26530029 [Drosophila willistoni]KRF97571.1 uncharacterized protein Dwil_GK28027 [Drosophila willistoni]
MADTDNLVNDVKQLLQQEQEQETRRRPRQQKSIPPPKPIRKKKTSTPTALLCELARLKAQQKYLECNQTKLNPQHFQDDDLQTDKANDVRDTKSIDNLRPHSSSAVISLINEIERLKFELDEKLKTYRTAKRDELQDMWHYMGSLREDVFQPERLSLYTMNALRERIVGLNGQLERLKIQNSKELEMLQEQYEKMEKENSFVWKESF